MLQRKEGVVRGRDRLDRDLDKLSYASMNWIRFKGSPCRSCSKRSMASQPPAGAPLARSKYYDWP